MQLHVSTTGSNANSGIDFENALATIQCAYDKLIEIHQRENCGSPSEIIVHDGVYHIDTPLHFYADLPVTICAHNNDNVVICGERAKITGWQKYVLNGKSVLRAQVSDALDEIPFLFDGDRMMLPARWPKDGFRRIAKREDEVAGFAATGDNAYVFPINAGDFDEHWHAPENILIRMTHLWTEETLRLGSYDSKDNCIHMRTAMHFLPHYENTDFCFLNVREALSEPGEFYFDRADHVVYCIPFDADDDPQIVIPGEHTLVRGDSGLRWLTLRGLHFRYAGGYMPECGGYFDLRDNGYAPIVNGAINGNAAINGCANAHAERKIELQCAQAAVHLPGALMFDHAADCVIEECEISQCGWYAICLAEGCNHITVRKCDLHTLGGGGISVVGANVTRVHEDLSRENTHIIITDNHVHDCGLFYYSAVGIIICFARHCLLEHNHIHDLNYTGISCGWTWGYGASGTSEIRIGWNKIHDLGKGILSDMGGIYTLGIQPGTRVYNNVIFNVNSRFYGGWGIYPDEGSSHIVIEDNLVYDCTCHAFHQHYGRENIIRHNIFAFGGEEGVAFANNILNGYASPGVAFTKAVNFFENVIITDGRPYYYIRLRDRVYEQKVLNIDFNFLYAINPAKDYANIENAGETQKSWNDYGLDRHSVYGDPGLVSPEKRDFRLLNNSILLEYGFIPWDYNQAGPRAD